MIDRRRGWWLAGPGAVDCRAGSSDASARAAQFRARRRPRHRRAGGWDDLRGRTLFEHRLTLCAARRARRPAARWRRRPEPGCGWRCSGWFSRHCSLTVGGGSAHRRHGWTCDNVVSMDVVTAGGGVCTVYRTETEDLFWAAHPSETSALSHPRVRLFTISPQILGGAIA